MMVKKVVMFFWAHSYLSLLVSCQPSEFSKVSQLPRSTVAPKNQSAAESAGGQPVTQSKAQSPNDLPTELSECKSRTLQTVVLQLDFPATAGNCRWDAGEQGGVMMGHLEQSLKLPVESNWVVCGMSIATDKTDITYDDYILLHFNERALIGSTGIVDMLEKDENELPRYQWSRLQGKRPQGTHTCLPGNLKCSLPGTEQNGPLMLELSEELNLKLMSVALTEKRFDFRLLTTGDNDEAIDCAHTGLPLAVTLKYYTR
jgi:hypothetical protein